jgi:hypothetical protein
VAERPKLIVHCITVVTAASVAVMGSIWALHRPPVTPEVDPDGQQVAGGGGMMTEGSPLQPRSLRGSSSWLAEYGAVDTSVAVAPSAAAYTAAEVFAGFQPGVAPLDTDRGDEDDDDGEEHGAWVPMGASRRELEQSAASDLHLLLLADSQSEGTTGELVV